MLNTGSGLPVRGSAFASLTAREWDVLRRVALDNTDRGIAVQLGISERTVRAHVSRIIFTLGVASRVGAAVAFVALVTRGEQGGGSAWVEAPIAVLEGAMAG